MGNLDWEDCLPLNIFVKNKEQALTTITALDWSLLDKTDQIMAQEPMPLPLLIMAFFLPAFPLKKGVSGRVDIIPFPAGPTRA